MKDYPTESPPGRLPKRGLPFPYCTMACLFLGFLLLQPGSTPAQETSRHAFYIGHSLISDIPDMVAALANAHPDVAFTFREQFIPGAPLRWQWEERDRQSEYEPSFQGRYHIHLATGEYDTLVATDSVPRGGEELVAESMDYLNRFARFAWDANPQTRVYYYETWHCTTTGTPDGCPYDTVSPTRHLEWRDRLIADRDMWLSLVNHVNEENPDSPTVYMIPGGTAIVSLVEAIGRDEVPGFETFLDLFEDDIHLNPYGRYFIACVHFATLYGITPEGLPFDITNRWGVRYWETPNWQGVTWPAPDPIAITRMQQIAWEVVSDDPATGIAITTNDADVWMTN